MVARPSVRQWCQLPADPVAAASPHGGSQNNADSAGPPVLPGWAVLAAVCWLLAYTLAVALVRSQAVRTVRSDLVYSVPDLVGGCLAGWAALRWRRQTGAWTSRASACWGWLAAACWLSFSADLLYAGYYYLAGMDDVFPSWADPLWVLSELAILPTIVLAFDRVSPIRQLRAALDALVALLGLGSVLWVLVLAPQLSAGWTLGAATSAAYPLVDLAVIVVLLSVGISGHERVPLPVLLLGVASALLAGTDLASSYLSDLHSYVNGAWLEIGWQASAVLVCLSALTAGRLACAVRPPGPLAGPTGPPNRPLTGRLPTTLAGNGLPANGLPANGLPGNGLPGNALTVDRELGLAPVLIGVTAVLALVGIQAARGAVSGGGLALAAGTVVTVVVRLLLSVADQREVARQLRESLVQTQRLAITDVLTELHNRRYTEQMLRLEVARTARDGGCIGVLMIDLDHFKGVNDTYGHQAGDAVLAEAALRLSRAMREVDVLGRWGGEEFLAVLRCDDVAGAMEVAERLLHLLRSDTIRLSNGARLTVTASIGVACRHGYALDADSLLRAADQALYEAKQAGRDRIQVADWTPEPKAVIRLVGGG